MKYGLALKKELIMRGYAKGILLGIFVTGSCVGFIASKSNSIGR